jgi:YidC/Oxa1 family membrane protein insertase
MDSQKRLLIALGLSFAVTMLYMSLFAPKPPTSPVATAPKPAEAPTDAGMAVQYGAVPEPTRKPAGEERLDEGPVQQLERNLANVHFLLTTRGASLARAELQGPKMREQVQLSFKEGLSRLWGAKTPPPPQMDMARPVPGQALPLAVSIQGAQPFSEFSNFRVEDTNPRTVQLVARAGGWEVRKTFEWSPTSLGDELSLRVSVKNLSSQPYSGELGVHYARAVDPRSEEKPSFFGGVGNLSSAECTVGETVHKLTPDDKPSPGVSGPIQFFGIDQQYFLAAVFPLGAPADGRCQLTATPEGRSVVSYFPLQVMPGQTVERAFGVYVGPKDIDMLIAAPAKVPGAETAVAAVHLEKTVDFGIWAFICKILLAILRVFYRFTSNWGLAIIGLTVVVKIALLPLTHKAMVSGEAMKKLQPKIEELRKKHGQDKERQNREMMKLYQEARVNPLGGCLPMLIQMPVWIALWQTLRNAYEIYSEPFIPPLWTDLTFKDPTYILPLALCITMIVTQKLQPQMMDATQAKVMTYVMPVFFTAIILNYPAGLSLYIFTNNILSIGQQYGLRKYLEKKSEVTGRKAVPKPAEKRR